MKPIRMSETGGGHDNSKTTLASTSQPDVPTNPCQGLVRLLRIGTFPLFPCTPDGYVSADMKNGEENEDNLFARLTSLTAEPESNRIENFCTECLA